MVYCPACLELTEETICCDNDCSTIICQKCDIEIYPNKYGEWEIGHHSDCGKIPDNDHYPNYCPQCGGDGGEHVDDLAQCYRDPEDL